MRKFVLIIISFIFVFQLFGQEKQENVEGTRSQSKFHGYNKYLIQTKVELKELQTIRALKEKELDSLIHTKEENKKEMYAQKDAADSLTKVIRTEESNLSSSQAGLAGSEAIYKDRSKKSKENNILLGQNSDTINQYNSILRLLNSQQTEVSTKLSQKKLQLSKAELDLNKTNNEVKEKTKILEEKKNYYRKTKDEYEEASAKQTGAKVDIGDANTKINLLNGEISEKSDEKATMQKYFDENKSKINSNDKEISSSNSIISTNELKIKPLEQSILGYQSKISEYQSLIDKDSVDKVQLEFELSELTTKNKIQETQLRSAIETIELATSEKNLLEKENDISIKEKAELEQKKKKNEENIVLFNQEIEKLKLVEKELQAQIDEQNVYLTSLSPETTNLDSILETRYALVKIIQEKQFKVKDESAKSQDKIISSNSEINKINETIKLKQGSIHGNESLISSKKTEIDQAKTKKTNSENTIASNNKLISDIESRLSDITKQRTQNEKNINTENNKIATARNTLEPLRKKNLDLGDLISQKTAENNELIAKNRDLTVIIDDFQKEIDHKQGEVNSLKEMVANLQRDLMTYNEKVSVLKGDLVITGNAIKNLQTEVDGIKSNLDLLTIKVNEYTIDNDKLQKTTDSLTTNINISNKRLERLTLHNQKMTMENNGYRFEIDSLEGLIVLQKKDVDSLDKLVESLKTEKTDHKKNYRKLYDVDIEYVDVLKSMNLIVKSLQSKVDDKIIAGIDTALVDNHISAVAIFKEGLLVEPNNKFLLVLTGYTLFVDLEIEQAMEYLNRAVTAVPEYENIYYIRAQAHIKQRNYQGAVKDYNQVIYLNNKAAEAYQLRGELYQEYLNEWDKACEDWYQAVKLGASEVNKKIIELCNIPVKDRTYVISQLTKMSFDEEYGYSEKKPIKVGKGKGGKFENIEAYLNLLRDSKDHQVEYVRVGSCCPYPSENGLNGNAQVERYQVKFRDERGKKTETILYFSYYDYVSPVLVLHFKTNHQIY